ncbi:efflux RND transporter periplasmic adaptor subunit [Salipiger bermudensis]|uniref:efflux RND transporter periplasmic adaptor subunit n=1 Tax=Salipiger bermudensis TaxID=344736 RepID=UPI001C9927B7|nr:efflux RND transporter periplasmic adaptor subunit [Salipiger bermudensis]MBY6002748.1 efflux RND transporter periplasmic adaptor subunit [Salipiger bermudensis]
MTSSPSAKTPPRTELSFEDDPGAGRAWLIALAIIVGLTLWMLSGVFRPAQTGEDQPMPAPGIPSVAVQRSQAGPVTLYFHAEGQALPKRDTMIRSEASGTVEEILVEPGTDVAEGALLVRLSTERAQANLVSAEREFERARREYDNAATLLDRGVATLDRVTQAQAALAAAEAQLAAAREARDQTDIVAPFAGRIEYLGLELGEVVSVGMEVGRIIDHDPLTVSVEVPQQSLRRIRTGQLAEVSFLTGESREGEVSFVGTAAQAQTRTFTVEITVPNADGAIPSGISARVRIPTGETEAHFLSGADLSLDIDGTLGVKTVTGDNRVAFHPVQVVSSELDGVWATGLPDPAEIIVVGQGFVVEGEEVTPVPAEEPGQ